MTYHTSSRELISVTEKYGSGAEGAVFKFGTMAVKIFSPSECKSKEEKIRWLIAHRPCQELMEVSSWPIEMVYDENNRFCGYTMQQVEGRDLGDVISNCTRGKWKDKILVRIAAELIRTVDLFHREGFILGDFNPRNFIVLSSGRVVRIDIDSLHIERPEVFFPCVTGELREYTAPEIIRALVACGGSFADLPKGGGHSIAGDRFSMSVLVFRLLMKGVHPFSAVRRNPCDRDDLNTPLIKQNIVDGRCPYFKNDSEYIVPAYAPGTVDRLTPELTELFRNTFIGQSQSRATTDVLHRAVLELLQPPKRRIIYDSMLTRKEEGRGQGIIVTAMLSIILMLQAFIFSTLAGSFQMLLVTAVVANLVLVVSRAKGYTPLPACLLSIGACGIASLIMTVLPTLV